MMTLQLVDTPVPPAVRVLTGARAERIAQANRAIQAMRQWHITPLVINLDRVVPEITVRMPEGESVRGFLDEARPRGMTDTRSIYEYRGCVVIWTATTVGGAL